MSIRSKLLVTSRVTVVLCVIMACHARADVIPFSYAFHGEAVLGSLLGCPP